MTNSARPHGRHWLSLGFGNLAARIAEKADDAPDFDVLIIGSGYGGSIAAHQLATTTTDGRALSIGLLERGNEYVEGEFPAETDDLVPLTRFAGLASTEPTGERDGLFDFRLGPDVSSLVGNGLGGGSLINAGVMIRPLEKTFDNGWPKAFSGGALTQSFDECERLLGAAPLTRMPQKFHALNAFSRDRAMPANVTIATDADETFSACNYCGNCATGCNFGAKRSLDVQLLAKACAANENLEVFTGAVVERIERKHGLWIAQTGHTKGSLRDAFPGLTPVSARYLILAAGTFGSTELLMKSRTDSLPFSSTLGKRFSTNGDMLAVTVDQRTPANALADGAGARTPDAGVGPTITGVFDDRGNSGFLLEEMNVPWPIRRLFEEVFTTSNTLARLGEWNGGRHRNGPVADDPFAVSDRAMAHTSVWALMGMDRAEGELILPDGEVESEGVLGVQWKDFNQTPLFDSQIEWLNEQADKSREKGRVLANPAWRPLPKSMSWFAGQRGPLFTVHPLGGCAMADSGSEGVVDECGRVFISDTGECYDGLVVLDGSVIPTSLGANPALTISAVALRAVRLLSIIWGLSQGEQARRELAPRPRYRNVVDSARQGTEVELHERLVGEVVINAIGRCVVELTLTSAPTPVERLTRGVDRRVSVLPVSRIRVFEKQRYDRLKGEDPVEALEVRLDALALASASIEGELEVFSRQSSISLGRMVQGLVAWGPNRGFRDIYEAAGEWLRRRRSTGGNPFAQAARLASHAGERRTIAYRLRVVDANKGKLLSTGDEIEGSKLLTYSRAANPLKQLMEMSLSRFPRMHGSATLTLDASYLARIGIPLLRVVRQRDTPSALADLAGLSAYVLRMIFGIHAWTLRAPDSISAAPMRRLPGRLPGVPTFEQYPIPDPHDIDAPPLPAVLTRYRRDRGKPVLMIHGYSASGTTFAHECLDSSIAEYLWKEGRDVWVLDLRTSPGLPTSVLPWTFEQVADGDIPQAIDHIWHKSGTRSIDVIAHCMGAAMFSMTVLAEDADQNANEHRLRRLARDRINKVVLTQVGPGVVFSPANIFRAYAMSFLKHFLELSRFDFRVNASGGLADTLLDRLLNVLPYPDHEFHIENPWQPWRRAEFVSIRHRMDLLYGRDFSLDNVSDAFLKNIDAMFGPLNLDTVSQAMLFTRWKNITDRQGKNVYFHRRRIRDQWTFPTLSIHGRDNGLSSVETVARNRQVLGDAGVDYQTLVLDGFGHQDVWVSDRSAAEVFCHIRDFLNVPVEPKARTGKLGPLVGRPPYLGPILCSTGVGDCMTIRVGTSPNLGAPEAIALVNLQSVQREPVPVSPLTFTTVEDFDVDDNGMIRIELETAAPRLVLMLYDEHPALMDTTFGDAAVEMPASADEYDHEDPNRIRDAVSAALALPSSLLETGVVEYREPVEEAFTVAFGSCQFPAGLLDGAIAFQSWEKLLGRVRHGQSPDVLLLLGDQVYVDPTGGLFDPARLADRYRIPYERWLSADPVQRVLGRVPTFMMLDDHELVNDWQPVESTTSSTALKLGESAFRSYQFESGRHRNKDKFWGELDDTPVPIFMLNSRSERSSRNVGQPDSMFSDAQLDALTDWLARLPASSPKIITSASVLLPRLVARSGGPEGARELDGWSGYPQSMTRILEFIASRRIQRVIFLSGDEHLPLVARASMRENDEVVARIISIHTAALYAPLPFANANAEDFILDDRFAVAAGIECEVKAETFAPDFGFSYLTFEQGGSGAIRICFEGSGVERTLAFE